MSLFSSLRNKVSLPAVSFGFSKGSALKVFLYLLFGSIMFSGFLGLRFVERSAAPMLRDALTSVPSVNIQPGNITISIFPPRLDIDSIYVAKKRSRNALFGVKQLSITPDYTNLLSGKIGANLSANSYGGKIKAHVASGGLFDFSTASAVLDIKDQSLGKIPYLAMLDGGAEGVGTLHVQYEGSTRDVTKGEGKLTLAGSGLRLKNPVPIIKKEHFEDMIVTASVGFDGTSLKVDDFSVREKTMRGNVQGSMKLNMRNVVDSKVSMRSKLFIPPKELIVELLDPNAVNKLKAGDDISVSINGRLASPNIVMK